MGAYHQMGHDSESMILEPELNRFKGAILSPVNYNLASTIEQVERFRKERSDLDIVFDPQLYWPASERNKLAKKKWTYLPSDLDTVDPSIATWEKIVDQVVACIGAFKPDGLCSPAARPRTFSDEHYDAIVTVANYMTNKLEGTGCRPILTALVGLDDIGRKNRYLTVGSILGKFRGREIYLVLADEQPPRLERTDSGALEGAARLIRLLTKAGFEIIVGFTSSEMVLWKAAGAQHVASGKHFNLRRFTLGRWEDDGKKGGKSMWYWFEPSLLAFLREADIHRFIKEFPISELHAENPYSQAILKKLNEAEQERMQADSWRQFLFWIAQCDALVDKDIGAAAKMIENASQTWKKIGKLKFEEEKNVGEWINSWRVVINELERRPD